MIPGQPCELPAIRSNARRSIEIVPFGKTPRLTRPVRRQDHAVVDRPAARLVTLADTNQGETVRRDAHIRVPQTPGKGRLRGNRPRRLRTAVLPIDSLI